MGLIDKNQFKDFANGLHHIAYRVEGDDGTEPLTDSEKLDIFDELRPQIAAIIHEMADKNYEIYLRMKDGRK